MRRTWIREVWMKHRQEPNRHTTLGKRRQGERKHEGEGGQTAVQSVRCVGHRLCTHPRGHTPQSETTGSGGVHTNAVRFKNASPSVHFMSALSNQTKRFLRYCSPQWIHQKTAFSYCSAGEENKFMDYQMSLPVQAQGCHRAPGVSPAPELEPLCKMPFSDFSLQSNGAKAPLKN